MLEKSGTHACVVSFRF